MRADHLYKMNPNDILVRDYQLNLIDIAHKRNTIVYLPTGAGKTLIAVMLIKKLAEPLQQPLSQGGKISIMLANTTALVDQHSEYLKRLIPFEVGTYSGSLRNKTWNKNKWKENLDKFQVFVMTPRVLCNILNDATLCFENINLLIFDECHHAVSNHPMSTVMKSYTLEKGTSRILGLTATLLNKNCKPLNAIDDIKVLEKTLHSQIVTVKPQYTKKFSTNPKEIVRTYLDEELPGNMLDIIQELHSLLVVVENFKLQSLNSCSEKMLKDLKSIIQDTIVQIETFGIYGGKIAAKLRVNQLQELKNSSNINVNVSVLRDAALTLCEWIHKTFKSEIKSHWKDCLFECFSNRLVVLLDILKQHKKTEQQNFCAIIFIKRRLTVKILYHILAKLKLMDPEYCDLSPNFVLGSNCYSTGKSSLLGLYKAKVYKNIIEQFNKRHINLLVASNVLEEGIDIPTCTLIINFDEPKDYRGYIQSKGRARCKNSYYYLMISKNNYSTFLKSYENYKKTQDVLEEYFNNQVTHCESRIEVEDYENINTTHTPKLINVSEVSFKDRACSIPTIDSAVNLVNLYCLTLPHDKYTTYLPKWFVQKYEVSSITSFKAILRLPIICQHLGNVEGPLMQSKQLAINAAALKTCNLLKEKGELDDNWLPKLHTEVDVENKHFFQHWLKQENEDEAQKNGIYKKVGPKVLRQQIKSYGTSYIHVIELKPQFQNNATGLLFDVCQCYFSSTTFGFVTAQSLPDMCDFYIYVPEGAILVTVAVNKMAVAFSDVQIQDLRIFHYGIFKKVLGILENFLIFDNSDDATMLLLIPVCKYADIFGINFEILQMVKHMFFEVIDRENKALVLKRACNNAFGKVVTLHSTNENYLICSNEAGNLQGRHFSKDINYLHPSRRNIGLDPLKPESYFQQEFPSDLWVQAQFLPSILYRIYTILEAIELRTMIMADTGLGSISVKLNERLFSLSAKKYLLETCKNLIFMDGSIISMDFDLENGLKRINKPDTYKDSNFAFICYKMILSQMLLTEVTEDQDLLKIAPSSHSSIHDFKETSIKLLEPKQGTAYLGVGDVIKALTGMKCNDVINYERAETLGDSFLKFAISLFIVLKYSDYNEGKATVFKSSIISNKNLFYVSLNNNLYKYLRNTSYMVWKPPGFIVPKKLANSVKQELNKNYLFNNSFNMKEIIDGVLFNETSLQTSPNAYVEVHNCYFDNEMLTNKALADCVEALVGIYFESYGLEGGLKMLTWLEIVPPSENIENLFTLSPINPVLKQNVTENDLSIHLTSWQKIEHSLGYTFKNRAYLLQAVTHASYNSNDLTDCYQKLEFLGDAILDFLITCHIYENYTDLDPGDLTDLRSALVNNVVFAGFTVRHGFYKYLLLSNESLLQSIDRFVQFQETRNFAINDNVLILSEKNNLYIAEHGEVPKVLGDLFESFAAAVFFDSGMNLQIVWKVFYRMMWKEIQMFSKNVPKNPVRLLYEATKAKPKLHNPVIMNDGTMVAVDIFLKNGEQVTVYGFGENKRCAKKAAATLAVRLLYKNGPVDEIGINCHE